MLYPDRWSQPISGKAQNALLEGFPSLHDLKLRSGELMLFLLCVYFLKVPDKV